MHITLLLIWIIITLSQIEKAYKYSEIREKGIYLDRGFYDWNKIYCYEWMSPDTIKFKIHSSILSIHYEKVKVSFVDNKEIDEILKKYINHCSSTCSSK